MIQFTYFTDLKSIKKLNQLQMHVKIQTLNPKFFYKFQIFLTKRCKFTKKQLFHKIICEIKLHRTISLKELRRNYTNIRGNKYLEKNSTSRKLICHLQKVYQNVKELRDVTYYVSTRHRPSAFLFRVRDAGVVHVFQLLLNHTFHGFYVLKRDWSVLECALFYL